MMILKSIEGQSRYGSTRGARCVQACVGGRGEARSSQKRVAGVCEWGGSQPLGGRASLGVVRNLWGSAQGGQVFPEVSGVEMAWGGGQGWW